MGRFTTIIDSSKSYFSRKNTGWVVLVVFALMYAAISFVNHYTFRTSSDPQAIYTNCLYDYRQLQPNECTLLTPTNAILETPFFNNKLSDHFNVILFLIAPFSFLFGSYTLLVFQWIAILFGGWGVRKFFSQSEKPWLGNMAMLHFFSVWGIYSALGFDYHDNVIAAMLLPWLLYYLRESKWVWASLVSILMLMCKENVSVWMVFVFASIAVFHWKEQSKRWYALTGVLVSLTYFGVVTKVIMPVLANPGREYLHFHFSALGDSYGEAITYLLMHPIETIKIVFSNHVQSPHGDGIKPELIYTVLISGGVALFFRPKYLIMIVPILGQKLLNDDILKWGLNYHYCIELVPVITFALFDWLSKKESKTSYKWALAFVVLTFGITTIKNNTRTSKWFDKSRHNYLTTEHYTRVFDVAQVHGALALIPDDETVKVSAHFNLAPWLSFRDKLYEFPVVHDAEYLALLLDTERTYPLGKEEFLLEVEKYRGSKCWEVLYDQNFTLILKRKEGIGADYDEYPWHLPKDH